MNAQKAKAIADEAKFKGVNPEEQRKKIDELIRQAASIAKYEVEFTNLHPDNITGLQSDGFTLAQRSSTYNISWK